MKIIDVEVFELQGAIGEPPFPPGDRQARPMDIYPDVGAAAQASQAADLAPEGMDCVAAKTDRVS